MRLKNTVDAIERIAKSIEEKMDPSLHDSRILRDTLTEIAQAAIRDCQVASGEALGLVMRETSNQYR